MTQKLETWANKLITDAYNSDLDLSDFIGRRTINNLVAIQQERECTKTQMAITLGMGYTTYIQYLHRGGNRSPTIKFVLAVCNAFDVSVAEFLSKDFKSNKLPVDRSRLKVKPKRRTK